VAAIVVGVLYPGEMGSALGAALRNRGTTVLWASAGRSAATRRRAEEDGLEDVGSTQEIVRRADMVVSVCPPHAAREVARSVADFRGLYVDANAVSPATAREIGSAIAAGGGRFVDGGIVGPPPRAGGTTRLYLSGPDAHEAARVFAGTDVDARALSDRPGDASALKMAYAAATKGRAALLLAVRATARAHGVERALLDEWRLSLPDLPAETLRAARSASRKGWRWVGEMEEIAATFGAAGLPEGFHLAAAAVFRKAPHADTEATDDAMLDTVLEALTADVPALQSPT
jgi:Domain of unknown function (DUF1932)/NAD binding domain of 6-phosphogluconate dehydrogenase